MKIKQETADETLGWLTNSDPDCVPQSSEIIIKHERDQIELTETELQPQDIYYNLLPVKMEKSDSGVGLLERIPVLSEANKEMDRSLDHRTKRVNAMVHPQAKGIRHQIRIHTGNKSEEKLYECSECKNTFKRRGYLRMHMAIHTGYGPYKCHLCTYKSGRKDCLKIHLKMHNEDHLHECSVCKRKFTAKTTLREHMSTHIGDKPHKCSMCTFKTSYRYSLVRHFSIHVKNL